MPDHPNLEPNWFFFFSTSLYLFSLLLTSSQLMLCLFIEAFSNEISTPSIFRTLNRLILLSDDTHENIASKEQRKRYTSRKALLATVSLLAKGLRPLANKQASKQASKLSFFFLSPD